MTETQGKRDSPRQTRAGSASAASSSGSGSDSDDHCRPFCRFISFPNNDILSDLTDDQLNALIFQYFQEKGFEHAAFNFGIEAEIEDIPIVRSIINKGFEHAAFNFGIEAEIEDIPIDRSIIKKGALPSFVRKGLRYTQLKANVLASDVDSFVECWRLDPLDIITNNVDSLSKIIKDRKENAKKKDDNDNAGKDIYCGVSDQEKESEKQKLGKDKGQDMRMQQVSMHSEDQCKVDAHGVKMPRKIIGIRQKKPIEEGSLAVTIPFDDTEPTQYEHFRGLNNASMVLSDDVITEVLSWLPAKTMVRVMACNRKFARLIQDPFLHALYMKRVNEGFALINLKSPVFDLIPLDKAFGLSGEVQEFMKNDVKEKLECQDGLIVYWSTSGDLRVLNPLTRKFSIISTPLGLRRGGNKKLAVCLQAINEKEYKIVSVVSEYRIVEARPRLALEVWRYSTHQWELIGKFDSISFDISVRDAVLVKQVLFWLAFCEERKLISFNIDTKTLQYVPFPKGFSSEISVSMQVAISLWTNETLALIANKKTERTMDIWARVDLASENSHWLKVKHVDLGKDYENACFHTLLSEKSMIFSVKKKIYRLTFEKKVWEQLGQFKTTDLSMVKKYVATFLCTGIEEKYLV